jgi:hypothetical protein
VPNGDNDETSSHHFKAWYRDVRNWEELNDFIEKNGSPRELYCLMAKYKCNLMQEEMNEEYMGSYSPG